jgi:2-C-methyl-D-erythritol 2,4-cyclodiphosphate synthase
LSAAGLEDLGTCFPDNEEKWCGASGVFLASEVKQKLNQSPYRIVDIDAVVLLEKPRIAAFRAQMQERVASALGISEEQVRLKGKSGEGLDAVGRGEAVACHAVALLQRTST